MELYCSLSSGMWVGNEISTVDRFLICYLFFALLAIVGFVMILILSLANLLFLILENERYFFLHTIALKQLFFTLGREIISDGANL